MPLLSKTHGQQDVAVGDDVLVTLSCDSERKLESRIELLTYAFAKVVQGAILRKIVKWDMANGCIQFVVTNITMPPGNVPLGTLQAKIQRVEEELPEVHHRLQAA